MMKFNSIPATSLFMSENVAFNNDLCLSMSQDKIEFLIHSIEFQLSNYFFSKTIEFFSNLFLNDIADVLNEKYLSRLTLSYQFFYSPNQYFKSEKMKLTLEKDDAFDLILSLLEEIAKNTKANNSSNQPGKTKSDDDLKTSTGEKLLTSKDVCKKVNCSLRALATYRDIYFIPYVKIGKKVLYKESDIDIFIEKQSINIDNI